MNFGGTRALIKQAEAKRQKQERKQQLELKLEEAKNSIRLEQEEKEKLSKKATQLREQIERIRAVSEDLKKTEADFSEGRNIVRQRYLSRTKPIEGKGMLTFAYGCGDPQTRCTRNGRHSRRTAYTTNYNNEHMIGAGCEWVETIDRRDRALKRLEEKETKDAEQRAITSLSNATDKTTASQLEKKRMYSSPLQDLGYHGKPSIIFQDIDLMKGYSLRRLRYYTDFFGNRIPMDPCDWPRQGGIVLTGL
jgi:hypothetical protein